MEAEVEEEEEEEGRQRENGVSGGVTLIPLKPCSGG